MSVSRNESMDEFSDQLTDKERRRRSLRLLGSMLRPHRWILILVAVLVIISQAAAVLSPALVAFGIDTALPQLLAGEGASAVWLIGGIYLATALVRTAATYAQQRLSVSVGQTMLYRLRMRIFRHTQKLSMGFHERYTSGRIISRQTNDTDALRQLLDSGVTVIIGAPMQMVLTMLSVILMDWVTGLMMIVLLIPGYFLSRWFQRASSIQYRATRTHSARLTQNFVETMGGIRAAQAFRREEHNDAAYATVADDYRDATLRTIRIWGTYQPSLRLLGNLIVAVVLLVGGLRVLSGSLPVGMLLALVLYSRRFFQPLDTIAQFYNVLQSAVAALEKISSLLAQTTDVPEPENPSPLPQRTAGTEGREVRLDNVTFRYSSTGPEVLHETDLVIPAGQTIALVGQTGAGKSTIAKLIARFYDATTGTVSLDGVDVRELSDEDLHNALVMVTQESYLFGGSVADNIAIGRPDATREEIRQAAESVGALEFIEALPEGFDTDVHTRGGRLSAGQRQLVSFARAFLADPEVLILDEATSSLDIPSERLVQDALHKLMGHRTAIVIAHRLATIMSADRVLVVDDGKIIEDGTPDELIENHPDGEFAELYRAWQDSLQ